MGQDGDSCNCDFLLMAGEIKELFEFWMPKVPLSNLRLLSSQTLGVSKSQVLL